MLDSLRETSKEGAITLLDYQLCDKTAMTSETGIPENLRNLRVPKYSTQFAISIKIADSSIEKKNIYIFSHNETTTKDRANCVTAVGICVTHNCKPDTHHFPRQRDRRASGGGKLAHAIATIRTRACRAVVAWLAIRTERNGDTGDGE